MSRFISIAVVRDSHEDASLCSSCGGRCCKSIPGEILPSDLGADLSPPEMHSRIRQMLQSGDYTIDWWEGPPVPKEELDELDARTSGYYLRPATKAHRGHWFDDSWGGTCTFHTEAGCSLSAQERPSGCLSLIPELDETGEPSCRHPAGWEGKLSAAKAWWPYRGVFKRLRREDQA